MLKAFGVLREKTRDSRAVYEQASCVNSPRPPHARALYGKKGRTMKVDVEFFESEKVVVW